MKNKNIWWIILVVIALLFLSRPGLKLAGETLGRTLSTSEVSPGGTFTLTYDVIAPDPPYFFSIADYITGGCTVLGSTEIITTLTSPQTETGALTVQAPGTAGTCTFDGDWQLGANPIVPFTQGSVRVCSAVDCVQSSWAPSSDTECTP